METFEVHAKVPRSAAGGRRQGIIGVNASGNLEILAERVLPEDKAAVSVTTAVAGYRTLWEAVIADFFARMSPGGVRFSINDGGARPDTVSLRLMQSARLMEGEQ